MRGEMMFDIFIYGRKFKNLNSRIKTQLFYKPFFKKIGKKTKIIKPLILKNTNNISLGQNVTINEKVFLMTEFTKKGDIVPNLVINDNVTIGNYNHIVCANEIIIENHVLTADKVYISDNIHCYEDINIPISMQGIKTKEKTIIGEETWIGENSSIICCNIGKHCVIGANSVVLSDIPDYCVAAGIPARIIKKYDFEKREWIKYDS